MNSAALWLAIAGGGALGALMRGAIYRGVAIASLSARTGTGSRLGLARATLVVNLVGSFILGILIAQLAQLAIDDPMRSFWVTGFCGSLTTFSTFCADAFHLARNREHGALIGFLVFNGLLCLVAFSAGLALAH